MGRAEKASCALFVSKPFSQERSVKVKKLIFIVLTVILALFCFVGCEDEVIDPAATELKVGKSELVDELIEYLESTAAADTSQPSQENNADTVTFEEQINRVKSGDEAIHVGFDASSEKYYVCAYYNFEEGHNEKSLYCCAEKYTWVSYENSSDIKEYYGKEKFTVAFQLDRSSFATNILTDEESETSFENFSIYEVSFENGVNTSPEAVVEKSFLYIDAKSKESVYYNASDVIRKDGVYPCINFKELCLIMAVEHRDFRAIDVECIYEFGDYVSALMKINSVGTYYTYEDGQEIFYSLFEINMFADFLLRDNTANTEPTGPIDEWQVLIDELISYLKYYESEDIKVEMYRVTYTVEDYIDRIKRGAVPLHAVFDAASEKYYVCAYYNFEEGHNEKSSFCCSENYTWVKYDKASDITEYHGEEKFYLAFQLDRAGSVTNILTDETSDIKLDHFQLYDPEFENGVNIADELVTEKSFIYSKATIGRRTTFYFHPYSSHDFNCIYLEGEYYITVRTYDNIYEHLGKQFGEYADALFEIMDTERYSVTLDDGTVQLYAIFEIGEFTDAVLK